MINETNDLLNFVNQLHGYFSLQNNMHIVYKYCTDIFQHLISNVYTKNKILYSFNRNRLRKHNEALVERVLIYEYVCLIRLCQPIIRNRCLRLIIAFQ